MTTMMAVLIFAARGEGGPVMEAVQVIGSIILVIAAVVLIVRETTASDHLEIKGGLPHCPRCHRQVSYRRDVCRACGYTFRTYWGGGPEPGPTRDRDKELAERIDDLSDKIEQWGLRRAARLEERRLANAKRREARVASYRDRGIEPGPLAWFRVLPDWQQAVFLGLAFAAPVVGLIVFLMR